MATTFDEKIPYEKNGLQLYGLFKRGDQDRALPLVVLIHGSGATAAYFDNSAVSYALLCRDPFSKNTSTVGN